MPSETSAGTATATTYPTVEQYERWKKQADEMDLTVSEFIKCMTEAGRKDFEIKVEPDETTQELREQRNDLTRQLEQARERVESLEDRLHHDERHQIERIVEENPGASFADIVQHFANSLPDRVTRHLDELEGTTIQRRDDGYYAAEEGEL